MQGGGGFGPPPGPPPGGFGAPPGPPPGGFGAPPGPPPGGGFAPPGAPPGGGYGSPPGGPPGGFGPQPGGVNPGANEQLSVVSVGLGAGSILTSCISFLCCIGYVSIPLGIAAIVTGVMSLQRQKLTGAGGRPLAIAGIACGAIGIVVPLIWFVVALALGLSGGMLQGMQGLQQH